MIAVRRRSLQIENKKGYVANGPLTAGVGQAAARLSCAPRVPAQRAERSMLRSVGPRVHRNALVVLGWTIEL
jgi:hypothetical protein